MSVFPEEHRHLILLLFPRLGCAAIATSRRRWTSLSRFNHRGRHGSGLGSPFHLPQPFSSATPSARRWTSKLGGNPIPELGRGGQKEILAGLRDLHFGTGSASSERCSSACSGLIIRPFSKGRKPPRMTCWLPLPKEGPESWRPRWPVERPRSRGIPKGFGLQPGYR